MKLVWKSRMLSGNASIITSRTSTSLPSIGSDVILNEKGSLGVPVPTVGTTAPEPEPPAPPEAKKFWSWRLSKKSRSSAQTTDDPEKGSDPRNARPVRLFAPIYSGLGLGLAICEPLSVYVASGRSPMTPSLCGEWLHHYAARIQTRSRLYTLCASCDLSIPCLRLAGTSSLPHGASIIH